jgi:hypothetical protein
MGCRCRQFSISYEQLRFFLGDSDMLAYVAMMAPQLSHGKRLRAMPVVSSHPIDQIARSDPLHKKESDSFKHIAFDQVCKPRTLRQMQTQVINEKSRHDGRLCYWILTTTLRLTAS